MCTQCVRCVHSLFRVKRAHLEQEHKAEHRSRKSDLLRFTSGN